MDGLALEPLRVSLFFYRFPLPKKQQLRVTMGGGIVTMSVKSLEEAKLP
jgi:hypothetical protein